MLKYKGILKIELKKILKLKTVPIVSNFFYTLNYLNIFTLNLFLQF